MSDEALAPPADATPRPRRAVVEVTAGIVLGVPEYGYHRRWEVGDVPDPEALREQLALCLAEAHAYAGRLPLPEVLNWLNIHAVWL